MSITVTTEIIGSSKAESDAQPCNQYDTIRIEARGSDVDVVMVFKGQEVRREKCVTHGIPKDLGLVFIVRGLDGRFG